MSENVEEDEWAKWWDARTAAMQTVLGEMHNMVGHAGIPFEMGADVGGSADIVYFHKHLDGVVCVTSELIGCDDQVKNSIGNYELMICHRKDDAEGQEWGADIISRLAYYTCQAELNPGQTMDIGSAVPDGSTIAAFAYFEYAKFDVLDRKAGLLLCVGITSDELEYIYNDNGDNFLQKLKEAKVYPFTDLYRKSVL